MKFADVAVGDELGVKSTNHNALEYYRYASCKVTEVMADRFRTTRGTFMKESGALAPGPTGSAFRVAVSKAELAENNIHYRNSQRHERLTKSISKLVEQLGDSSEDVAVLSQANDLLQRRVDQARAAAARLEPA